MTNKELVLKMCDITINYYETSNVPEFFAEAFDTVNSSIEKFDSNIHKIKEKEMDDKEWEKLIYQIIFDLEYGWGISYSLDMKEDVIGQKNLSKKLIKIANDEGFNFTHCKLSKEKYNELIEIEKISF